MVHWQAFERNVLGTINHNVSIEQLIPSISMDKADSKGEPKAVIILW